MPYAQVHYPFENKDEFEASFPADFISEAMDQTRGWFYTLLVLATHLFGTAPWKNLIVCGHVLAADGKKMSKSLKNYPDPNMILDRYGADALRLFLINSPVVRGDSLRFKEEGVKEVISHVLLPLLNSYRFFLGQAALLKKEQNVDYKYDPKNLGSSNVMDRWILARCQTLIKTVKTEMEGEFAVIGLARPACAELTRALLSVPPVHGRQPDPRPHRRAHQLVHPFQPEATEGRERSRRHAARPQHPLRDALHPLPHPLCLHPLHHREHLPRPAALLPRRRLPSRRWLGRPLSALPALPGTARRVL